MSNLATELSRTRGKKEVKHFMGLFGWFGENFQALKKKKKGDIYCIPVLKLKEINLLMLHKTNLILENSI